LVGPLIEKHCETWPGVVRTAVVAGATVAISWHDVAVSERALWVLLALGSPALFRTIASPLLAWMLKSSIPMQTKDDPKDGQ